MGRICDTDKNYKPKLFRSKLQYILQPDRNGTMILYYLNSKGELVENEDGTIKSERWENKETPVPQEPVRDAPAVQGDSLIQDETIIQEEPTIEDEILEEKSKTKHTATTGTETYRQSNINYDNICDLFNNGDTFFNANNLE